MDDEPSGRFIDLREPSKNQDVNDHYSITIFYK